MIKKKQKKKFIKWKQSIIRHINYRLIGVQNPQWPKRLTQIIYSDATNFVLINFKYIIDAYYWIYHRFWSNYEWYILSKFDQLNFILTACHIDKYYIFGFISISLPHNRQLYRLTTDRLVDIPSNNACTREITLINMIIPCVIFNARTQFHFDRCTFSDKSPLHIIPWNKMNFISKTLNISSLQILVLAYGIF